MVASPMVRAHAVKEADIDRANYDTTIADLMSGQHWKGPLIRSM